MPFHLFSASLDWEIDKNRYYILWCKVWGKCPLKRIDTCIWLLNSWWWICIAPLCNTERKLPPFPLCCMTFISLLFSFFLLLFVLQERRIRRMGWWDDQDHMRRSRFSCGILFIPLYYSFYLNEICTYSINDVIFICSFEFHL